MRSLPGEAVLVIAALAAAAWGQTQPPANVAPAPVVPVLENSGKPIVLPFRCTEYDIQWAGLSCSEEEPCAVYLEISAAESVGSRVFAAGNIHSESVTLFSVLLGSPDAGHTWREAHERIRGAGLDRIQFVDSKTGWVGGQSLFPLPQDPFLLITSDGGETWRQQPVFSETHYGAIQEFFFSAKTSGSLVIDRGQGSEGDRYARYESPDGGETWMIREESNKPIGLKVSPAAASDWRVRADGPTQSFRIERRQGGQWDTVSAFAVSLGACKPPPASNH